MISPARLAHQSFTPANTHFHVRLQVRVSRHHVPYLRPVVVLTTRSGARL